MDVSFKYFRFNKNQISALHTQFTPMCKDIQAQAVMPYIAGRYNKNPVANVP
jgi:hypothetical protein